MLRIAHFIKAEVMRGRGIVVGVFVIQLLKNRFEVPFARRVFWQRKRVGNGQVLFEQPLGRVEGMVRIKNIDVVEPGRRGKLGHLPFLLRGITDPVYGLIDAPLGTVILLVHADFDIAHLVIVGILILFSPLKQPMAVLVAAPIGAA